MVEQILRTPVEAGVYTGSHYKTAASWSAIIAGAFVAISASLILLALGSGLGFAEVSPWSDKGVSGTTFTITAAIWFIVTQWVSACLGGYISGRLRARWFGTHPHEVFFRDTAHGLVTWSVATVFVAGTLASTLFTAIGGGVHAAANVAGAASSAAVPALAPDAAYNVDRLFREGPGNATAPTGSDPRAEAGHIIANAATTGSVPDADRTYLADLVASRTGIAPADAQKRVDDYITAAQDAVVKAKAAADDARKAAAETSIYMALSLLVGAFIASVSAVLGGRIRDEHL